MKAKEYAKEFQEQPTGKRMAEIAVEFVRECASLAQARNAKTDDAMFAIFEEQEKKWRAFCRAIGNEIAANAEKSVFSLALKELAEPAWAAWQFMRKTKR